MLVVIIRVTVAIVLQNIGSDKAMSANALIGSVVSRETTPTHYLILSQFCKNESRVKSGIYPPPAPPLPVYASYHFNI